MLIKVMKIYSLQEELRLVYERGKQLDILTQRKESTFFLPQTKTLLDPSKYLPQY